jgi:folate-binding protein YgfZ
MTPTIIADLVDTTLIRFAGDDAQPFLHGQLSCDVAGIQPGRATYGSYNNPKGRMLASFLLWRDEHGYVMQLPRDLREPIQKRLAMYILRSKVKATDVSNEYALIGLSGAHAEQALKPWFQSLPPTPFAMFSAPDMSVLRLADDRFEIIVAAPRAQELKKALAKVATPVGSNVWNWLDIRAGVAHIAPATQDQFVPQMANLDLIGGVSFSKGCYPGQEIVARMHYLGRLKQRMYLANIAAELAPLAGDKIYSADFGDQACGMIVNAAPSPEGGYDVLAVIQIESANRGDVRLKSTDGPPLRLLELPYKF